MTNWRKPAKKMASTGARITISRSSYHLLISLLNYAHCLTAPNQQQWKGPRYCNCYCCNAKTTQQPIQKWKLDNPKGAPSPDRHESVSQKVRDKQAWGCAKPSHHALTPPKHALCRTWSSVSPSILAALLEPIFRASLSSSNRLASQSPLSTRVKVGGWKAC